MPEHKVRPIRPAIEVNRQGRILFFDEDAEELKRVGALIAAEGYKVCQCKSFSEAIDHLTDEPFDIVVIGQEAGLEEEGEVAEWARAVDARLPVLMLLTESRETAGEGKRWRADVSEFLMKPATPVEESQLKETLRGYLKPRVASATDSGNPS
jgi:DNA-binding NtrC family response regulator